MADSLHSHISLFRQEQQIHREKMLRIAGQINACYAGRSFLINDIGWWMGTIHTPEKHRVPPILSFRIQRVIIEGDKPMLEFKDDDGKGMIDFFSFEKMVKKNQIQEV